MKYSKYLVRVYLTNWINLVGIIAGTFLTIIVAAIFSLEESAQSLSELFGDLLMTPFFLLLYGLLPMAIFLLLMLFLDIICFSRKTSHIFPLLFVQWLVLVIKPIEWAIDNNYWLWVGLSVSFLVTQYLRSKQIDKLQNAFLQSPDYSA